MNTCLGAQGLRRPHPLPPRPVLLLRSSFRSEAASLLFLLSLASLLPRLHFYPKPLMVHLKETQGLISHEGPGEEWERGLCKAWGQAFSSLVTVAPLSSPRRQTRPTGSPPAPDTTAPASILRAPFPLEGH